MCCSSHKKWSKLVPKRAVSTLSTLTVMGPRQLKPGELSWMRHVNWGHPPQEWVPIPGEAEHVGAASDAASVLINGTGPQDAPRHWDSVNNACQLYRCWVELSHLGMAWEQTLFLGHTLDVATWFQRPGGYNGPGTAPGWHLQWAYCTYCYDWAGETALGPDPTSSRPPARSAPDVNIHLSAKVSGSPTALDQLRTYPFAFEILT